MGSTLLGETDARIDIVAETFAAAPGAREHLRGLARRLRGSLRAVGLEAAVSGDWADQGLPARRRVVVGLRLGQYPGAPRQPTVFHACVPRRPSRLLAERLGRALGAATGTVWPVLGQGGALAVTRSDDGTTPAPAAAIYLGALETIAPELEDMVVAAVTQSLLEPLPLAAPGESGSGGMALAEPVEEPALPGGVSEAPGSGATAPGGAPASPDAAGAIGENTSAALAMEGEAPSAQCDSPVAADQPAEPAPAAGEAGSLEEEAEEEAAVGRASLDALGAFGENTTSPALPPEGEALIEQFDAPTAADQPAELPPGPTAAETPSPDDVPEDAERPQEAASPCLPAELDEDAPRIAPTPAAEPAEPAPAAGEARSPEEAAEVGRASPDAARAIGENTSPALPPEGEGPGAQFEAPVTADQPVELPPEPGATNPPPEDGAHEDAERLREAASPDLSGGRDDEGAPSTARAAGDATPPIPGDAGRPAEAAEAGPALLDDAPACGESHAPDRPPDHDHLGAPSAAPAPEAPSAGQEPTTDPTAALEIAPRPTKGAGTVAKSKSVAGEDRKRAAPTPDHPSGTERATDPKEGATADADPAAKGQTTRRRSHAGSGGKGGKGSRSGGHKA